MATPKLIRVELKGQPGGDVYKRLHSFMTEELLWSTEIVTDTGIKMPLPSATYCGVNDKAPLDLAVQLRDLIIGQIWPEGARVLVINWAAWGEAITVPW